jgi:hypothetical protein
MGAIWTDATSGSVKPKSALRVTAAAAAAAAAVVVVVVVVIAVAAVVVTAIADAVGIATRLLGADFSCAQLLERPALTGWAWI